MLGSIIPPRSAVLTSENLRERLDRIATQPCPVAGLKVAGAVWVSPDLRAEIAYRGVTTDRELRHASFKGIIEG